MGGREGEGARTGGEQGDGREREKGREIVDKKGGGKTRQKNFPRVENGDLSRSSRFSSDRLSPYVWNC